MPAFTLKHILVADAITCAIVFALGVLATPLVASLLGLPTIVVMVAGWICLPSALLMVFLASQKTPNAMQVNLVVLGNIVWVVVSVGVVALFSAQMTWLGIAFTVVQAIIVLDFAIFEARGAKTIMQQNAAFS